MGSENNETKEKTPKKNGSLIMELKKKIRALKTQRQTAIEASDKKTAVLCRRRIAKLKKKTRRAA